MPRSTVIPVLVYPELAEAVDWLCEAFGSADRLRIGNHRVQLTVGEGSVVAKAAGGGRRPHSGGAKSRRSRQAEVTHSVMACVEDVDRHFEHARKRGARVVQSPADYPYGERQYTAEDPGGHEWTFSQSIADVAPEEWGGTVVTARG